MTTWNLLVWTVLLAHGPHLAQLNTKLFDAIQRDNPAAVKRLLIQGADPSAVMRKDERRIPALNEAAEYGNVAIVRLLLAYGANVKAVDSEGNTALSEAACDIGDGAIERKDGQPLVQALLAHEANPRTRNVYGYTAIRLAEDRSADWLVRMLKQTRTAKKAQKNGKR